MSATILVLDDRDADRNLLVTVLGYAGHEVLEATNGVEGLKLARARHPDLVISDILMPGMNGYEFARELRDDPSLADTLIVFATATYDQSEVRRLADACGVRHFLPKPTEPEKVIKMVAEALGDSTALPAPVEGPGFDREQLRVLNDKLVEKVGELERATAERQELIVELLQMQEGERSRIAAALHDDPIQVMAAISMRLGALHERLEADSKQQVAELRREVLDGIDRLRELVFELEPLTLRTQGLEAAVRAYLERVSSDELEYILETRIEREPEGATRTLLYRIASEALANVRKHSGATRVSVLLGEREGGWLLRVTDNGRGFDPAKEIRVRPGHLGLAAIRERLQMAGGTLTVQSTPGEGTIVEVRVPALEGPPG
jgi:signal transduction histidine kinase